MRTSNQRLDWIVDVDRIEKTSVLRGWTRSQLAEHAHIDPGTLSDLLAVRRRPTLGTVMAVCEALGLQLCDAILFR
ncbi:MAG: helix-turn-helix transcriptional regulator [Candidatus Dormibacteraeota bacterium]|nr:helix-turn-helix transcriptional regulator [Candidatus Dormibacteraeota bacterium]